jgi:8-amino-3,8-dideoxy-alpha-D-manno-octulosonate transaminase
MTTRTMLAAHGGTPARQVPLPPSYPGALFIGDEEKQAAIEVIESQSLFRYYGPHLLKKSEAFEVEFARRVGTTWALGVSSGTAALRVALMAIGVGPGDEVIVPCYTFVATIGAVVQCGAVPVFCELDESFGIDPADLQKRITPYTKAVIPVHFSGVPNRMDEINAICRPRGIVVLEDVAQACGARYKGRMLGSVGDIGTYSFQLNKIITAGEGGAVVTNDERLIERAVRFHDQGFWRGKWDQGQVFGENYRINELSAAILSVQLGKLDTILGNMRARKQRIMAGLSDCTRIRFRDVVDPEGEACNSLAWICGSREEAREFMKLLNAENVSCGQPYGGQVVYMAWPQVRERRVLNPNASPWNSPFYKGNVSYEPGICPRSEDLVSRAVWMGIMPTLTETDADQIVEGFRKVYEHMYR